MNHATFKGFTEGGMNIRKNSPLQLLPHTSSVKPTSIRSGLPASGGTVGLPDGVGDVWDG